MIKPERQPMIKPEQVPETVAHAAEAAWSKDATWQQIVAAAINAWPGMSDIPAGEFDGEQYPRIIHLPLPAENSNADG